MAKGNAILSNEFNYGLATEYYQRALEINPNNVDVTGWLAFLFMARGEHEKAIAMMRRLVALDPLSVRAHRGLGDAYRAAGRYDDAISAFERALELEPGTARVHGRLARMALVRGDYEAAAVHISREPVQWVREMLAIMINGKGENSESYRAAVAAYADAYGEANSFQIAELYGFVGDLDNVFKWLQKGVDIRDPGIPWMTVSEFLVPAHGDPRWDSILEQAGF